MVSMSLPKRFYLPRTSRSLPLANGVGVMATWREIEAALTDFAKSEGLAYDEQPHNGDHVVWASHADGSLQCVSLTELAKELAERLR